MILFVALLAAAAVLACAALACVALTWAVARRAAATVPPVGRFVEVNGVRLHYVAEGIGPPILMIHGLGSQLQTFTYALAERLRRSHRLIVVDRPGCGYSQAAPTTTLATQATLLAGLLDRLAIERVLVVGHSLGGAIALALALDNPARVAGLALLAPATQPQDKVPAALRAMAIRSDLVRWLVGWIVVTPLSLLSGRAQLAQVFAPEQTPGDFGTRAGGVLQARPAAFRSASRDLVEAGQELAAYAVRQKALAIPIGVLFGTADNLLDPGLHGAGLAANAPVDLELVDGAGHMLPITQPDRCAALVRRVAAQAFVDAAPAG